MSYDPPMTAEQAQQHLEQRRRESAHYVPSIAAKASSTTVEGLGVSLASVALGKVNVPLRPSPTREQMQAEVESCRAMRAAQLLLQANVPKRQMSRVALDRSGPWQKVLDKLTAMLGTGFMVALVGSRGNGKTQLAVELIRTVVSAKSAKRARFCTATEFFMEVKSGYRDDGKPEADVIRDFQKPSLLVIDEIGQRRESEWERLLLYELLNRRYNDMTDTLVISNQTQGQLEEALGPALISRMSETGGVICAEWPSYRSITG